MNIGRALELHHVPELDDFRRTSCSSGPFDIHAQFVDAPTSGSECEWCLVDSDISILEIWVEYEGHRRHVVALDKEGPFVAVISVLVLAQVPVAGPVFDFVDEWFILPWLRHWFGEE